MTEQLDHARQHGDRLALTRRTLQEITGTEPDDTTGHIDTLPPAYRDILAVFTRTTGALRAEDPRTRIIHHQSRQALTKLPLRWCCHQTLAPDSPSRFLNVQDQKAVVCPVPDAPVSRQRQRRIWLRTSSFVAVNLLEVTQCNEKGTT